MDPFSFLGTLSLTFNELTGALPSELGLLVNLRGEHSFVIHYTWASQRSFPYDAMCFRYHADRIDISFNQLTGPLPSELGHLTRMSTFHNCEPCLVRSLFYSKSKLTHPCCILSIEHLLLQANELSGTIPKEVSALNRLSKPSRYFLRASIIMQLLHVFVSKPYSHVSIWLYQILCG